MKTYLDRAKEIREDLTEAEIIYTLCPTNLDLETDDYCMIHESSCEECWNREYKEVEG